MIKPVITVHTGVVHYSKISTPNSTKYANDPEVMPGTPPVLLYPTVTPYLEAMCFVPGQSQPFLCRPESEIPVVGFQVPESRMKCNLSLKA